MKSKFTFIDLFSGIGGFRIPLVKLGGKCLGFSEIDKKAIDTYRTNFTKNDPSEIEFGDVTKLEKLPDVDLLVGGVPCQSWSVAGKMRGFGDPRGRLWYDSIRLVEINRPKAFIFENVRGLYDPRNRENLMLIVNNLENTGYTVSYKLLNSYDFGVPQNRERIYIVGIRKDIPLLKNFEFPKPNSLDIRLYEFLENITVTTRDKGKFDSKDLFGEKIPFHRNRFQKLDELNDFFVLCDTRNGHTTIHSWDIIDTTDREKIICMVILRNRRKKKYGAKDGNPLPLTVLQDFIPDLEQKELDTLVEKKILKSVENEGYEFVNSKNSAGVNGIYRVYLPHSPIFSTLTATGTKDYVALEEVEGTTPEQYKDNFINNILKKNKFRKITPREAGKLQGFPDSFQVHKDEKTAHFQFGNAVSVPVVYNVMKSIIDTGVFGVLNRDNKNGRSKKTGNSIKSERVDEEHYSYQPL